MMRTPHLLKSLFPAVLAALCLFAQPAWSITIDASAITDGTTQANVPGAQIDASGGTFLKSSFNGWDGFFGVQNGAVPTEIDIFNDEFILITFDTPQVIESIIIGRLFAEGNFFDLVNERADIFAERAGASPLVGQLEVIDASNASWSESGSVQNLSLGDESGAGVWEILAPFGDSAITSLKFDPFGWPGIGDGGLGENSDFALLSVTTTVPEPHTAALFALGLLGLGVLGRRERD